MNSMYVITTDSGCFHEACKATRLSSDNRVVLEAINEEQKDHLTQHGYSFLTNEEVLKEMEKPEWQGGGE